MTRLIIFLVSGILLLVVGGVAGAQIKEMKLSGRLGSTQEWKIEKLERKYY